MKKYALLMCINGGNQVLAECSAANQASAIEQLQLTPQGRSITLDKDGYAKVGDTTYTVAEYYNSMSTAMLPVVYGGA